MVLQFTIIGALQGETVRTVVAVVGHLADDAEKGRQFAGDLLRRQGSVRLEDEQTRTATGAGLLVDVQLKVDLLPEEASTHLDDGVVTVAALGQHCHVVPAANLPAQFHFLGAGVRAPDQMLKAPAVMLTSLS